MNLSAVTSVLLLGSSILSKDDNRTVATNITRDATSTLCKSAICHCAMPVVSYMITKNNIRYMYFKTLLFLACTSSRGAIGRPIVNRQISTYFANYHRSIGNMKTKNKKCTPASSISCTTSMVQKMMPMPAAIVASHPEQLEAFV